MSNIHECPSHQTRRENMEKSTPSKRGEKEKEIKVKKKEIG